MAMASGIAEALFDIVGREHVWLRRSQSLFSIPGVRRGVDADAVVFPGSSREVADVIRGAAACGIPTTVVPLPSMGGTRWSNPGGIVLVLTRMSKPRGTKGDIRSGFPVGRNDRAMVSRDRGCQYEITFGSAGKSALHRRPTAFYTCY